MTYSMHGNNIVGEMQQTKEHQTLGLLKRSWERVHWQCTILRDLMATSSTQTNEGENSVLDVDHREAILGVLHLGDSACDIMRRGSLTEDIDLCMQELFPLIDPLSGVLFGLEGSSESSLTTLKNCTQILFEEIRDVLHALALFSDPAQATLPKEVAKEFSEQLDFVTGYQTGV